MFAGRFPISDNQSYEKRGRRRGTEKSARRGRRGTGRLDGLRRGVLVACWLRPGSVLLALANLNCRILLASALAIRQPKCVRQDKKIEKWRTRTIT